MYTYQGIDFYLTTQDTGPNCRIGVKSPGSASRTVTLDFPARLDRSASRNDERMQELGGRLFRVLFPGDAELSAQLARLAPEEGLAIRLHIDSPPLRRISWELMYDADRRLFPALDVRTPVVRVGGAAAPRSLTRDSLRVLVLQPTPRDARELRAGAEFEALREGLQFVLRSDPSAVRRADEPVTAELAAEALASEPWDIVHLSGHAVAKPGGEDFSLLVQDKEGMSAPVNAAELSQLLAGHASVRLLVLIGVDSALVADRLIGAGFPATLTIQPPYVTTLSVVPFVRRLYAGIADGLPLEQALADARRAVWLEFPSFDWAAPVLTFAVGVTSSVLFSGRTAAKANIDTGQSVMTVTGGVVSGVSFGKEVFFSDVPISKVGPSGGGTEEGVTGVRERPPFQPPTKAAAPEEEDRAALNRDIEDLKTAIRAQTSISPRTRVEAVGAAEKLRLALKDPNPDMALANNLIATISALGEDTARVAERVRRQLMQ